MPAERVPKTESILSVRDWLISAKPPWKDNFTVVYTGQVYTDSGKISFRENADDRTHATVDGNAQD